MKIFTLFLFSLISFGFANAQNYFDDEDSLFTASYCSTKSLNFPLSTVGISLGNSQTFTGLRINYSDCGVNVINGVNITMWRAKNFEHQIVNGVSLGLIPISRQFNGFSFGLAGVIARSSMIGVNVGGLALISQEKMLGLNFSGLASVSQENLMGINFSGLANVSQSDMTGLNFSGLANVSQEYMIGLNISGLANVAEKGMQGFNFSMLANVASEGSISGLSITLGKIFAEQDLKGFNFAGYNTVTQNFSGINITPIWTEVENLSGFSFSLYNEIYGRQNGISIGLVNFAEELHGLQIGLINIAKNKESLKVLPFVNFN